MKQYDMTGDPLDIRFLYHYQNPLYSIFFIIREVQGLPCDMLLLSNKF